MCAYKYLLGVTTIVKYEFLKLKYFKAQSVRSTSKRSLSAVPSPELCIRALQLKTPLCSVNSPPTPLRPS